MPMVLATPEFVNAVQKNGEAIRMKDGAGFQIAKRAIWVDSAAANAPEEPSKKCDTSRVLVLFVFNEMRWKLLGMV
ncbi:MAG: hypothetical protein WB559_11075 [Candidatus Acidiferrales bacterium]